MSFLAAYRTDLLLVLLSPNRNDLIPRRPQAKISLLDRCGHKVRKEIGGTGKRRAAHSRKGGGITRVKTGSASVIEREQADHLATCGDDLLRTLKHLLVIAA